MARRPSATISHPDGFKALLDAMTDAAGESALRQAAVAGARVIHEEVRLRAPTGPKVHMRGGKEYPPGTLKKNIIIFYDERESVTPQHQVYGVTIGRDAFYGRIVEDGHRIEHGDSRTAAHPFFRPGVDAKTVEALKAMTKVMQQKLNKARNV